MIIDRLVASARGLRRWKEEHLVAMDAAILRALDAGRRDVAGALLAAVPGGKLLAARARAAAGTADADRAARELVDAFPTEACVSECPDADRMLAAASALDALPVLPPWARDELISAARRFVDAAVSGRTGATAFGSLLAALASHPEGRSIVAKATLAWGAVGSIEHSDAEGMHSSNASISDDARQFPFVARTLADPAAAAALLAADTYYAAEVVGDALVGSAELLVAMPDAPLRAFVDANVVDPAILIPLVRAGRHDTARALAESLGKHWHDHDGKLAEIASALGDRDTARATYLRSVGDHAVDLVKLGEPSGAVLEALLAEDSPRGAAACVKFVEHLAANAPSDPTIDRALEAAGRLARELTREAKHDAGPLLARIAGARVVRARARGEAEVAAAIDAYERDLPAILAATETYKRATEIEAFAIAAASAGSGAARSWLPKVSPDDRAFVAFAIARAYLPHDPEAALAMLDDACAPGADVALADRLVDALLLA